MADQAEVETALVETITKAVYPNGVDQAGGCGTICRVYRGWPQAAGLDVDIRAGVVNITVFPVNGTYRRIVNFKNSWLQKRQSTGLSVEPSGLPDTVLFEGTTKHPAAVGLLVNNSAYRYDSAAGDTAKSVAEAMSELVRADRPAFLLDASIRVPGAYRLLGRVVGQAVLTKEIKRQVQQFRVGIWCPGPDCRDAVGALVEEALSSTTFVFLPDGSAGHLLISGCETSDKDADLTLYRRDILIEVEYPTTLTELLPSVLFGDLHLNGADMLA